MSIYIDVTEVVGIGATTGIQRVVREIARRGMIIGAARGQNVIPVVAIGGYFHRLSEPGTRVLDAPAPASARQRRGVADRIKSALRRRAFGLFAVAQQISFSRRLRAIARTAAEIQPVALGTTDIVVLIDTFWNGSTVLSAARRTRSTGARIVLVIYDLFPIRQPGEVDPQLAHVFPRLLERALGLADAVLTISRQVSEDVLDYFGHALLAGRVRHFYLGHDFGPTLDDDGEAALPPGFTSAPGVRYLMVGTIEPRRGHAYVLDAFEQLWAEGGDQVLMLIGRIGWRMDDFISRCHSHPEFGIRLLLLHDASDATLAAAIRTTNAMIVASYFEGFGLPLVEALLARKPVLASDIPIFREIADGAPLFFRCGDSDALADAIRAFERNPSRWQDRAAEFRWLDWDQSTRMFLDQISEVITDDANHAVPS